MDAIIRQIRSSRPAPGFTSVRLPGDQARETTERYRRDGVPVSATTAAALVDIAHSVSVDPSPLEARG